LASLFNLGDEPDLSKLDVHVSTSLVSYYFSEMPNGIFHFEDFEEKILDFEKIENFNDEIYQNIKNLILKYPNEIYILIKSLFLHLKNISDNSNTNLMNSKNLSIIFGPLLFRSMQINYQNAFVERIINNFEKIFN
jgi:hypothetical protein